MAKVLTSLELGTLIYISEAEYAFYRWPSNRHDKTARVVMATGITNQHLNVSIVDTLRFEGYVQITNKNSDSVVKYLALTDTGKKLLEDTDNGMLLSG